MFICPWTFCLAALFAAALARLSRACEHQDDPAASISGSEPAESVKRRKALTHDGSISDPTPCLGSILCVYFKAVFCVASCGEQLREEAAAAEAVAAESTVQSRRKLCIEEPDNEGQANTWSANGNRDIGLPLGHSIANETACYRRTGMCPLDNC